MSTGTVQKQLVFQYRNSDSTIPEPLVKMVFRSPVDPTIVFNEVAFADTGATVTYLDESIAIFFGLDLGQLPERDVRLPFNDDTARRIGRLATVGIELEDMHGARAHFNSDVVFCEGLVQAMFGRRHGFDDYFVATFDGRYLTLVVKDGAPVNYEGPPS